MREYKKLIGIRSLFEKSFGNDKSLMEGLYCAGIVTQLDLDLANGCEG